MKRKKISREQKRLCILNKIVGEKYYYRLILIKVS